MGVSAGGLVTKLPRNRPWRAVSVGRFVLAGLVVAVLDISFAATYWVVIRQAITFPQLLRGIASGILGDAAATGGTAATLLGALVHCTVAFGWAAVFLGVRRWWPAFDRALRQPGTRIAAGMLFGMTVWLVMDFVVLPLSHASVTRIGSSWFRISLAWHAIGVGLPYAALLGGEPERS